ncbi:YceI family protein [Paradesertivirga mongoliensis]|uniref:YceI family protein n=1 Tax=Paradesertivirga mongoliensis TaxID=2100740 RepID=A0ABW4ZH30_9SPHI|nr:YceI family protein [Pedobacter mongoliensis]
MISVKKSSKLLLALVIVAGLNMPALAQNFTSKNARVRFFSSTPIEDIKAASDNGVAVLIGKTASIAFQVAIKSFEFSKGLMQEHFNENYMESDKYPYAKFNGKINQSIDFSKEGEYNVTATGILLIHGVPKQRTIPGKIRITNGTVQLIAGFDVACADHNIKIPKLVMTKIAEVIKVNIDATLKP